MKLLINSTILIFCVQASASAEFINMESFQNIQQGLPSHSVIKTSKNAVDVCNMFFNSTEFLSDVKLAIDLDEIRSRGRIKETMAKQFYHLKNSCKEPEQASEETVERYGIKTWANAKAIINTVGQDF
jgi:hypothetical protein